MNNPFETIIDKLNEIDSKLQSLPQGSAAAPPEIINAQELCKRLDISEPTLISLRKKKRIPFIKMGPSSIRYNWPAVIDYLQSQNDNK